MSRSIDRKGFRVLFAEMVIPGCRTKGWKPTDVERYEWDGETGEAILVLDRVHLHSEEHAAVFRQITEAGETTAPAAADSPWYSSASQPESARD